MILTPEHEQKLRDYLWSHHIRAGLGTEDEACSIAAINLSITGELTDDVPACMSEVIGSWIIPIQDAMPDDMRNSGRWKSALVRAAGTGRDPDAEQRRLALILDWMWGHVLPLMQPVADANGVGSEWAAMCRKRTSEAAWAARAAASEAARAAASEAARAAAAAWALAAEADPWPALDPVGLLEKLVQA